MIQYYVSAQLFEGNGMQKFETYEQVAQFLLHQLRKEFGFSDVEGKQKIKGNRSNTEWKIDAKGVCINNEGFVIIECRRYTTSKQNQEKIGGLAYRIIDSGAKGGIIVSPLGLQSGAEKVALSENIINVILDPNSTPKNFTLSFLSKIFAGVTDTISISEEVICVLTTHCEICKKEFRVYNDEKICPDCLIN